jgi:hypothetical protein
MFLVEGPFLAIGVAPYASWLFTTMAKNIDKELNRNKGDSPMSQSRKWSPLRRKLFAEKQAARKNPPAPAVPATDNFVTPIPQSPFMQLSNSLWKFHDELQSKLHDLAGLFRY